MRKIRKTQHDGAEICELVGLFILNNLCEKHGKHNIGLYRDDGIAFFNNISGPDAERTKKDVSRRFKSHGLNITIKTNMKIANFLDVTFNLAEETYYPYRKPDDTTGKFYIGLTERTFKQRFNQHKLSFNSKNYANSTELSNYIWELKDTNKEYHIQWSIITSAASYFNIVIIEYAVKFMVLWEMFVYKLAEDSANIGLYTYVVWRVVPDYVALSFPFAVCG